eukprot:8114034-Pyramimonas_sp.AAC.1
MGRNFGDSIIDLNVEARLYSMDDPSLVPARVVHDFGRALSSVRQWMMLVIATLPIPQPLKVFTRFFTTMTRAGES